MTAANQLPAHAAIKRLASGELTAEALMRACLDHCATHGLARLSGRTHAANEAMQSVYEMFGFDAKHVVYERMIERAARPTRPRPKPGEGLFRRKRGKKGRAS